MQDCAVSQHLSRCGVCDSTDGTDSGVPDQSSTTRRTSSKKSGSSTRKQATNSHTSAEECTTSTTPEARCGQTSTSSTRTGTTSTQSQTTSTKTTDGKSTTHYERQHSRQQPPPRTSRSWAAGSATESAKTWPKTTNHEMLRRRETTCENKIAQLTTLNCKQSRATWRW